MWDLNSSDDDDDEPFGVILPGAELQQSRRRRSSAVKQLELPTNIPWVHIKRAFNDACYEDVQQIIEESTLTPVQQTQLLTKKHFHGSTLLQCAVVNGQQQLAQFLVARAERRCDLAVDCGHDLRSR